MEDNAAIPGVWYSHLVTLDSHWEPDVPEIHVRDLMSSLFLGH